MNTRLSTKEDIDILVDMASDAKKFMKDSGHTVQWDDSYPNRDTFLNDLENGFGYVITDDLNIPIAYFALCIGVDKTYEVTYDGPFRLKGPYGVIHRVMINSDNRGKGLSKYVLNEAIKKCRGKDISLRIDTHKDNVIMIRAIKSVGFEYATVIILEDGSERLAYEMEVNFK